MNVNAEIDTTDNNKTIIRTTLKDYASEDAGTLDVVIEITADGIEIRPANDEDLYNGEGGFHREVWVEFYCSQLRTIIWDGTQGDPVIQHVLLEKGE
jgi:hypothetical protein